MKVRKTISKQIIKNQHKGLYRTDSYRTPALQNAAMGHSTSCALVGHLRYTKSIANYSKQQGGMQMIRQVAKSPGARKDQRRGKLPRTERAVLKEGS